MTQCVESKYHDESAYRDARATCQIDQPYGNRWANSFSPWLASQTTSTALVDQPHAISAMWHGAKQSLQEP
ncbi:MAG: hypothetical protein LZF62_50007 [Nitrospira sp.]|nr:MAG: hypothetical protein LZF62_50007 [Nitrospira sp.]